MTPNMNLALPVVTVTIGPDWASDLNAALELVDSHDHSSGKGAKITPAGITVNTNLNIDNNIFYNFKATRYEEQLASLTGSSYVNAVYSVNGDLYWTNGSGTAIQITNGPSIAAITAEASVYSLAVISSNTTISSSDTYVFLEVDTTAARTITLPAAASVVPGRFYIIKDSNQLANTNNITVNPNGADTIDGLSSLVINSQDSSYTLVSNGTNKWYIA